MCEENTSQKERFLQEVEQKLLRKELDARLLEDGLIRVKWNGQPLCSVDRDGIVRFRPADITGAEVDRKLRTVTQVAAQVKEYMQIFDRAPALKAVGLDDTYKVLADFGDAVLAGQLGVRDLAVIGIGLLIAVLALTQLGLFLPMVLVAAYAFLSIHLDRLSVLDFLSFVVSFYITEQQIFEWEDPT